MIFQDFLKKTAIEWSITTREIEDAYFIGPGATKTMLEKGLSRLHECKILQHQKDTIDGLSDYVQDNPSRSDEVPKPATSTVG